MLNAFYQLIFHPLAFSERNSHQRPSQLGLLIVFLASLANVELLQIATNDYILTVLVVCLFYLVFFAFYSVIVDFFAQLMSLKAKSLDLFFWLLITLLPITLKVPLGILSNSGISAIEAIVGLANIAIAAWMIVWQITILKNLYSIGTKRAIALYLSPLLIAVCVLICFLLLVGLAMLLEL